MTKRSLLERRKVDFSTLLALTNNIASEMPNHCISLNIYFHTDIVYYSIESSIFLSLYMKRKIFRIIQVTYVLTNIEIKHIIKSIVKSINPDCAMFGLYREKQYYDPR